MSKSSVQQKRETQSVLITGGTGLIGTKLSDLLRQKGYTVSHLSGNPAKSAYPSFYWSSDKKELNLQALEGVDAVIHLAGAGVADKRWTKKWKKEIYDSRIDTTRLLVETLKNEKHEVKQFISASAIGFYGWDTGSEPVDEDTPKGAGFLAYVVADWEKEAEKMSENGIKTAKIRVGIVLSNKGGALVKMLTPVKSGFGAPLASGRQYMSWIHEEDLCRMFIHILEHKLTGTFNGVSPNPIDNATFTSRLARQVKKPLWLPRIPACILKSMLGEMSDMLIGGNRVASSKIENTGFTFRYPTIDGSLKQLLR